MGGYDRDGNATNRVDMMVIENQNDCDTKVSWRECAPMISRRREYAALYARGKVLSVSCFDGDGQGTCESYDVLSQTAVELEHKLPCPNLCHVAIAELDDKVFVIGGAYEDSATGRSIISDRVLCLDNKRHRRQADGALWIEQEARLVTARYGAAATAYQGKVWLAGGIDGNGQSVTSIEVFDPLVGTWQAAGDLTEPRDAINIGLFATCTDDLIAAGSSYSGGMWVEKYNAQNGIFQLVGELSRGESNRSFCAVVACGSTVYFIGGKSSKASTSWNSFDTQTGKWTSQEHKQNQEEATRQMPRSFRNGKAVCITPNKQLSGLGAWTSYPDFVQEEEDEDEEEEEEEEEEVVCL